MASREPAGEPIPADRTTRTLLVGTGPRAVRCARRLARTGMCIVVGAVDSAVQPGFARELPDVPWLGAPDQLRDLVPKHRVDEIVVALPLRSGFDRALEIRALGEELGVAVWLDLDLPDTRGRQSVAVKDGAARVRLHRHPASCAPGRQIKRLTDVVLASLALVALSPLMLAVVIAVKLSAPGPALFRQLRIGRGGRVFWMLKFRTMVTDAEQLRKRLVARNNAAGGSFKIFDDPRVIPIGRWLRRTSVDEMPQLLNVLRGEMSLVGPRPIPAWIADQIDTTYHRRLAVLPGLTGLWQVRGRVQDFDVMGRHDLEYVDRWSPLLDLRIMISTIPAVLRGTNAY